MGKKYLTAILIVLLILVIVVIGFQILGQPPKKYLENQSYCEKDSDCIENMSNCELPTGILNCRNKYYHVPKNMQCLMIDIGIGREDRCLCNKELNKCEIART